MYLFIGDGHHERLRDEDDELLQFAIQQSLMDGGTENEQVVCLGLSCCILVTFVPISGKIKCCLLTFYFVVNL